MKTIKIIKHTHGAIGLRFLGLGPNMIPNQGMIKLKQLFDEHTCWAQGRSLDKINLMLAKSTVVITAWYKNRLVGFGRATSDSVFRSNLWDVVVASDQQGNGIGSLLIDTLLKSTELSRVERTYLMTTHCSDFYKKKGFKINQKQKLLMLNDC